MPSPDTATPRHSFRRIATQAGFVASAFAVFTCGWLAMRADDWKMIVLFSILAVGGAALTSVFSRAAR